MLPPPTPFGNGKASTHLRDLMGSELGAAIVGEHAGDLIAEFIPAMRHRAGLGKILATSHIYPTLAKANKYAADAWKRSHAPQNVLAWLERYPAWMRA